MIIDSSLADTDINEAVTTQPKVHIVIPARYNSTRLPGKPLLLIHDMPMILWVAKKASQASFADDLCIATDDDRIADVCRQAGYDVVMTDRNHASGTDRLAEVAQKKGWHSDDIVVNMQGDEPLVPPELLKQARDLLVDHPDCVMATLCEPIHTYETFLKPSVVKVVTDNRGHALYFSRAPIPCNRDYNPYDSASYNSTDNNNSTENSSSSAQDTFAPAYRHLGLYAYRVKLLQNFVTWPVGILEGLEKLEQLRVLENGEKIAIAPALANLPAGVDTQEDLARLNALPISAFK